MIGTVYKLTCEEDNHIYIGSTTKGLQKRYWKHKSNHKNNNSAKLYCHIKDFDKWKIETIEEIEIKNRTELRKKEQYWIDKYSEDNFILLNEISAYCSCEDTKLKKKEYWKKNEEYFKLKSKEYREKNKEILAQKSKEYREENREILKQKAKEHYENNKEQYSQKKKEYYYNNKEKISEQGKEYYKKNRELLIQKKKEYYEKNREILKKKSNSYYHQHKNDPNFYNNRNKEEIKKKRSVKNECPCGGSYLTKHRAVHFRTKKHKTWEETQNN